MISTAPRRGFLLIPFDDVDDGDTDDGDPDTADTADTDANDVLTSKGIVMFVGRSLPSNYTETERCHSMFLENH